MSRLSKFLASTIGAKVVVAVTGILLSLFIVGHLAGNLLVFKGQDAVNGYAASLQSLGPALWLIRAALLAVLLLHVVLALLLKRRNQGARPVSYVHESTVEASWASRHMVLTGLLVLAFLLLHLAHFTVGWLDPKYFDMEQTLASGEVRHDVYGMVVMGFHDNVYVVLYLVAMALLGLHLSHGLHSLFQTLGVRHAAYTPLIEKVGRTVAWILAIGYMAIPLTIRLGLVGTDVTP